VTTNRNLVPQDSQSPNVTSGLRMGTSAIAARGMADPEASALAEIIANVLDRLAANPSQGLEIDVDIAGRVLTLAERFPLYPT
ncbi:serine hydroxymethyltransferase, partial [Mesorhizobium sp. M0208]